MADARPDSSPHLVHQIGLPGPFVVQRPLLTLLLAACTIAMLLVSGEPGRVGGASDTAYGLMSAIKALGLTALLFLLAGLFPPSGRWRWPLLGILLAGTLTAAALAPDPSGRLVFSTGGLIAITLIWLGRFAGRAGLLMSAVGLLPAAAGCAALIAWSERHGIGWDAPAFGLVWLCLSIVVMASVYAAEGFADRLAKRDGLRLAAALRAGASTVARPVAAAIGG